MLALFSPASLCSKAFPAVLTHASSSGTTQPMHRALLGGLHDQNLFMLLHLPLFC